MIGRVARNLKLRNPSMAALESPLMGITHFDAAPRHGSLTALGDAAGAAGVDLRRIELPSGGHSATPGDGELILYVLSGRGRSRHRGRTDELGGGDCAVYPAGTGSCELHALQDLDVLAFTAPGRPAPGERPATVVNLRDLPERRTSRARIGNVVRDLGRGAGSVVAGLNHLVVEPGKLAWPQHCHSAEEEMYVILDGDGTLLLGEEETPIRAGHVVAQPPGTGVAQGVRAGAAGLTLLAYGTREPNDITYFPHSNKVHFRGVKLIARVERLGYWDGED